MHFKATYIVLITAVVLLALSGASCKKIRTLSVGGILQFSTDTLHFDTVFTAEGSFTRAMLIYNPQNEEITISSVRLLKGSNSFFHLNVDGFPGNNIPDLKIAPHDSLYVFATVNIDPNSSNSPFFITDSLVATLNGKDFFVPFTAYGQNAHYITSDSINNGINNVWLTDKPYVVIHNFVIGAATGGTPTTLTIPRGCRVYMHQDAQIISYSNAVINIGTTGTATDSVVFQGDRLDRVYFGYVGYPGEWAGLWFTPASTGNISHTVLKNCGGAAAYYGYSIFPAAVRVDSGAKVTLDHTIIENSITIGIFGFQGNVTATNCLVNTTGGQALAVSQGGFDTFINCTFANYGTAQVAHANAGTVALLDYYWDGVSGDPVLYYNMNVLMRNCLVYGSLDSEIICDSTGSPSNINARVILDHCLLKMGNVREPFVQRLSCLFNEDPKFKDQAHGDFHLTMGSPAIDSGTNSSEAGSADLDGNPRTVGSAIDIGCYEYH